MSSDKGQAQKAKALGNEKFAKQDFQGALQDFTTAIDLDATDPVFYSNRSACYANLKKYDAALADAEKCISLKPDWAKGYSRKGVALYNAGRLKEAIESYEKGLTMDPKNEQMKKDLQQCKDDLTSASRGMENPFGELFSDAALWPALEKNPTTREYMKDEKFVAKMKALQKNPNSLLTIRDDPQVKEAFMAVIQSAQSNMPVEEDSMPKDDFTMEDTKEKVKGKEKEKEKDVSASSTEDKKATAKQSEEKCSKVETEEDKKKKQAASLKEEGNALYRLRKFEEALVKYKAAAELEPANAVHLLNQSAVHFEKKDFKTCISTCEDGLKVAHEHPSGCELPSKLYLRLANAYSSLKDWTKAIELYHKSLVEQFSEKAKAGLKKAQDEKKKFDEEAYHDKGKSLQHKETGNKLYQEGKITEAIPEYTEAIRRDPTNPALYSNRAACYTKVMDWARGLEDCETALKLDPKFVKVYIRKGKIQHLLKQYHKALDTFSKGLIIDSKNAELIEAKRDTQRAIAEAMSSGQSDPERVKEAMKDPEIRDILRDPLMNKILSDMQNDPSAARSALSNPEIRAKLDKLIAAGVLAVQ
eukprot:TRINITY_DN2606_c0_g1_i1.p1 TRINITY_DN2606_c0_g1~~TRINITY_DN2606_c0_g1_i1.p1  ORF type:complete len:599 (+),score=141.84 TRINITY_DN2606_c0_g1_i1:39-1799(+)